MNKWEELDKKYIWHPFTQMKGWLENPQLVIDHGEGVKLYDTEGKSIWMQSAVCGSISTGTGGKKLMKQSLRN